jgi:hypothetical protein
MRTTGLLNQYSNFLESDSINNLNFEKFEHQDCTFDPGSIPRAANGNLRFEATKNFLVLPKQLLEISGQDAEYHSTAATSRQDVKSDSVGLWATNFSGMKVYGLEPLGNQIIDDCFSCTDSLVGPNHESPPDSALKQDCYVGYPAVDPCFAVPRDDLDLIFFDASLGSPAQAKERCQNMEFYQNQILYFHDPIESITALRDAPLEYLANLDAPCPQQPQSTHEAVTAPGPGVSATNESSAQTKRHFCNFCLKAFGRAGDLNRHSAVHLPGPPRYKCTVEGCERGERGFHRNDKRKDHQRRVHGVK